MIHNCPTPEKYTFPGISGCIFAPYFVPVNPHDLFNFSISNYWWRGYAPLYVYLLGTFFVTKHPSKSFDPWEVKKQVCHKPLRQSAFIFGTYIAAGAAKEKQWQSEVLFFSKVDFRELLSSSFSSHPLELTTRTLNTSCSSSNLFRSPLPPSPRWPPAISSATHYIDLPPHPPTAIALPFHTILFYVSGAQSATTAVPFISTESAVRRPMTYAYAQWANTASFVI